MNLGARIKAARKHADLTQAALAKRVGISQQMIGKIETGKSDETSALLDICIETGVSPSWLARNEGPMVASQSVSVPAAILRSAVELARKGMAHLGVDSIDFEEPEAAEVLSFAIDYLADDSSPVVSDSVVIDFVTALEKRNGQRGKAGSTRRSDGAAGGKEARKEGAPARRRRGQSAAGTT